FSRSGCDLHVSAIDLSQSKLVDHRRLSDVTIAATSIHRARSGLARKFEVKGQQRTIAASESLVVSGHPGCSGLLKSYTFGAEQRPSGGRQDEQQQVQNAHRRRECLVSGRLNLHKIE